MAGSDQISLSDSTPTSEDVSFDEKQNRNKKKISHPPPPQKKSDSNREAYKMHWFISADDFKLFFIFVVHLLVRDASRDHVFFFFFKNISPDLKKKNVLIFTK